MRLEVVLGGLLELGRGELRLQALHVDRTISGTAHNHQFAPWFVMLVVLGMLDGDDDVS